MKIIEATKEIVPKIVELWKELIDHHASVDPFFIRRDDGHKNFSSFLSELMDSTEAKVFIAIENNEVMGYTIAKMDTYPPVYLLKTYGEISDIAVTLKHRRKGIGSRLFQEALKWFQLQGLERVEVSILPKNIEASSFWKKQGFQNYMHKLYRKIS